MAVSVVPKAVIRMMGRRGWAACNWRTSSSPFRPGNFKSVMTTLNDSLRGAGQTVVAALFHDHFVAFLGQHPLQGVADAGVIVDQQNFGGGVHSVCLGQDDTKGRAAIHLGLILQRAAVFLHDARGDGQAQAGAGFLGGEKRIEQPLFHFRRNAFAGVRDFQDDDVGARRWRGVSGPGRARKVMVPSWPMLSAAFWIRLISTCLICAGVHAECASAADVSRTSWMLDLCQLRRQERLRLRSRGRSAGIVVSSGSVGRANWRKSLTIRSRREISRSTSLASACSGEPGGNFFC